MKSHNVTPYKLGDKIDTRELQEHLGTEGQWTAIDCHGHSAFALVVTKMADDWPPDDEKCQATAEFIVRACNSHDALVTALQVMVHKFSGMKQRGHGESYSYPELFPEIFKQAADALAAAGVQP